MKKTIIFVFVLSVVTVINAFSADDVAVFQLKITKNDKLISDVILSAKLGTNATINTVTEFPYVLSVSGGKMGEFKPLDKYEVHTAKTATAKLGTETTIKILEKLNDDSILLVQLQLGLYDFEEKTINAGQSLGSFKTPILYYKSIVETFAIKAGDFVNGLIVNNKLLETGKYTYSLTLKEIKKASK